MSNLLEKASILTTPTAYDNGKILSVKPEPGLGSELITNGSFDTDSDWNKQTSNWTIANGYAICDGLQTSNSSLFQDVAVVNGNSYRIDFTITDSANDLNLILGATTIGQYGAGTHSIYVTKDSNASARIFFQATASNAFQGSLDNVSIKELIDGDFDFTRNSSATRVNEQGLVEDVGANLPRIDYTDGVGSWLFEPQSTNLVTYSEDYGSGTYFSSFQGSTFDNTTSLSPSGENNATQLTSTGDGKLQTAGISLSQNTDYTLSFYAKNVDATEVQSRVLALGGSGGSNLIPISYFSELSTTEWKRITHSFNTGTNTTFYLYLSNALNSGGTIQIWGAQLEQSSFATSYIPTNGSTVTRLQDAAFGAGSSDLINSTEGVLYGEIAVLEGQTNINRYITINNGTDDNIVSIHFRNNALNQIRAIVKVGNSNQCDIFYNAAGSTSFAKFALKWKVNDFAFWVNGVKIGDDLSGISFNANTLNNISFDSGQGNDKFFGKTKCVAVFKEALTDEELTCLTTI
jgi:hypothetical protein